MVYCSVSSGEKTAACSTAVFRMAKRQRYGLLQCFEWRRHSGMVYCSVSNGEEIAIYSTAVFRMEKRQRYGLLQGF
jgi:hypothetical protein